MLAPAGRPRLPALFAATAGLALLSPAAETVDERTRLIRRDIPSYDPAAYEKAQAEKAAREATLHAALERVKIPPAEAATAPASPILKPLSEVLELPKVTVRPTYEPPKHLPRTETFKPPGRDVPGEPLESPRGRHDRLMRKHLSPLQRALAKIPFIGMGIAGSVHESEAREQKARQMNELADGIEFQELLGRDPEEIKKLRSEYQKLYYSGPR